MQHLAHRLEHDRKVGKLAGDLEQLARPLTLQPQRTATAGVAARQQQGARRALAKPCGEHGRAPDLGGHKIVQLVGLEQKELGAGRVRLGVGQPHDDAVVGRDRRTVVAVPLADAGRHGERPWRVHGHAVGRVQYDAPVAELVAKPLNDERLLARQLPGSCGLFEQQCVEVRHRASVEACGGEALVAGIRRRRPQLARRLTERAAQLGRAPEPVTLPERHLAGLPEGGGHDDLIVRDLLDAPTRGAKREHVAHARLVDHFFVKLADAAAVSLTRDEDTEEAAVGNRTATRHREPLGAGPTRERSVHSVPHDARAQFAKPVARVATAQQVEHGVERRPGQSGERRAAAHLLEPLLDVARLEGDVGDRLLGEHVKRVREHAQLFDEARGHAFARDRRVQHVEPVLGHEHAAADLAHLVAGAPDALQPARDARRCFDLDHQVDGTHVDAEFEAARRDDAAQPSRLEGLFDLTPLLFADRAVVSTSEQVVGLGSQLVDLVEASGQPFGEPPRVREHDCRAVIQHAIDDVFFDVRPDRRRLCGA